MVLFDLPVETVAERRSYVRFRKWLLKDGFTMMQYSTYVRHCATEENADVHEERICNVLPVWGHVSVLRVTDKQFSRIKNFYGQKPKPGHATPSQLEMF